MSIDDLFPTAPLFKKKYYPIPKSEKKKDLAKEMSVSSYMPESKPHLPANYTVSN